MTDRLTCAPRTEDMKSIAWGWISQAVMSAEGMTFFKCLVTQPYPDANSSKLNRSVSDTLVSASISVLNLREEL